MRAFCVLASSLPICQMSRVLPLLLPFLHTSSTLALTLVPASANFACLVLYSCHSTCLPPTSRASFERKQTKFINPLSPFFLQFIFYRLFTYFSGSSFFPCFYSLLCVSLDCLNGAWFELRWKQKRWIYHIHLTLTFTFNLLSWYLHTFFYFCFSLG